MIAGFNTNAPEYVPLSRHGSLGDEATPLDGRMPRTLRVQRPCRHALTIVCLILILTTTNRLHVFAQESVCVCQSPVLPDPAQFARVLSALSSTHFVSYCCCDAQRSVAAVIR